LSLTPQTRRSDHSAGPGRAPIAKKAIDQPVTNSRFVRLNLV
jgi:hypothetical protein